MGISDREPRALERGQNRILEMVALGKPLSETLDAVLLLIEEQSPGLVCSVAVASDDGRRCVQSHGRRLPAAFHDLAATSPIGLLHPNAVAEATQAGPAVPVTGPDNTQAWQHLLRAEGLGAVQSTPIRGADARVLGYLGCYGRSERPPAPDHKVIGPALHLASLVLERQRMQQRLRTSEQRFRSAMDAVQGVLWTNNAVGEMEGEQPGWAALTGQSQAEYRGYGWSRAVHPDDAGPTVDAWNLAVGHRQPFEFEHRIRSADGQWRTYAIRAVPSVSDTGEIGEWVGVHTDITAKKLAAIEQAQLAAVVRQSSDFIGFADTSGQSSFVNDAGLDLVGLSREADRTLSSGLVDYLHPDSKPIFTDKVLPAVAQTGHWSGELNLLDFQTGEPIPVLYSLFQLRDLLGGVVGHGTLARDLREHKKNELALQASEARFKAIFETVPVGIVIAEAPSGRIIVGNAQVEKILGHPIIESPDISSYSKWISHHADGTRVRAHEYPLARAIAGEERPELEVRYQRGDGRTTWVRFIATPIRANGAITGAIVASLDIDREKRALKAVEEARGNLEVRIEQEVRARETAQASLAHALRMEALGQLAGGIAHDFNNVLQSVSGGLGLIQKRAAVPEDVRRFAKMASDAVGRGASVTARLLAFARKGELRAAPIGTAELLRNLEEILASTIGTGITVQFEVAESVPSLLADKAQLETVLINLAINARDAMPEGGTLTIAAQAEHEPLAPVLTEPVPTSYVRIEVTDTGIGMDEQTLARAAEPFFTTKGPGEGTGLGLAMARGFALQSGGAFSISSTSALGTTVTLWLPQADGSVSVRPAPGTHAPVDTGAGSGMTVLLVDDDTMVREILAGALEHAGYRVEQAADGLAALGWVDQGNLFDLVVTDFSMPGMNGLGLLRELRHRRPTIPVIMLTGYADPSVNLDVQENGADGVVLLRKPIAADDLISHTVALVSVRQPVS